MGARVHSVIAINANGEIDRSLTLADLASRESDPNQILWVDLVQPPQSEELEAIGSAFDLSSLVVAHLGKTHRGPRAVRFLQCRLVVIFDVEIDQATKKVVSYELVSLIGDRFLVTAHPADSNIAPLASQQIEEGMANFGFSVGTLGYSLLNALVDRYDVVVSQIEAQVSDLRERILDAHEAEGVEDVYALTHQMGDLRRILAPEEALSESMHALKSTAENDALTDAFHDLSIDLQSAIDTIDQSSNLVSNLLDTYESLKSDALNNLVKRLTVLSIMLALVALIPAILGISLNVSPFRNGYQGYLVSLLLMVIVGWVVWVVAHRIGWVK